MLRLGAALPLHNLAPGQQVAYIQQAEASGYEGIWVPEVMGTDAFTVLAAAAQVTQRLRLGTGIVPIYTRTPTTLAMTIATLDALSGGRAVLGLGVSSEIIIGAWHGLPFPKPLGAMREAVDIIRRLLICALVARGERAESKSDGDRAGQFHHSIPCCGGQSVRAARSFPEPQYAQWPFSVPALQQLSPAIQCRAPATGRMKMRNSCG